MYDIIIIGGGAAGCLAAITGARRELSTLIVEKNQKIARKVLITGKGRCNVTNHCDSDTFMRHIRTNARFLYSALQSFSPLDTIRFFEAEGIPLKTERGGRVFPQSDHAMDIVDALYRAIKKHHIELMQGEVSSLIFTDNRIGGVVLKNGEQILSKSVIIATGGLSYPLTGSTGDGYRLAEDAGHTVIDPKPALTSIETEENYPKKMQGLSLKNIRVTLLDTHTNKMIYSDIGEMLFTHFGVSGPLILTMSSYIKEAEKNKYQIKIDLKPALSQEMLDRRILSDFAEFQNRDYMNSFSKLLPRKMIPVIVNLSKIDGRQKTNQISKEDRYRLVKLLKELTLTVKQLRPIDEAIITSGGVSVKEINPKTMESKKMPGLYFAGEVIDVDAETGGFNLQIAFSTGYAAGNSI